MKRLDRPARPVLIQAPGIAVYAGSGASHSFLWLADLLERAGLRAVRFIDENDLLEGPLDCDCLVFSGGAPAQMAEALGRRGAERVRGFIEDGGTYVGICAGACLPLHSRKGPLSYFNWVKMPVANISDRPPPPRAMAWKYTTPYGSDFVYHPVREDVAIAPTASAPAFFSRPVTAPLYGGPPLMPPDSGPVDQWGRFAGFSKKTLFLADEDVANKVVLDKAALAQARMGNGSLLLFSPHLEHPLYPDANRVFLKAVFSSARPGPENAWKMDSEQKTEVIPQPLIKDIRRTLSNCRVRITGLIPLSIRWRIGQKLYEPEKAFEFIDAIWKRLALKGYSLDRPQGSIDSLESILDRARHTEGLLREISEKTREGEDSTEAATRCLETLRAMTRDFLNLHMATG